MRPLHDNTIETPSARTLVRIPKGDTGLGGRELPDGHFGPHREQKQKEGVRLSRRILLSKTQLL